MESSECRRRTSDAEESARSYSVTAECEPAMVKEEPEWGECGVSEAAAAGGLYAGHEVKDEVVIAPELIQQQDIAFSMTDGLNIKEENQHEAKTEAAAAVAEGLYAGHQVKYELVIGPEVVQQQDIAYSMQDVLNIKYEWKCEPKLEDGADTAAGCTRTCPGDVPRCNKSTVQQYGLRSGFSMLEQFPAGDLLISRDGEPSHSLAPSKLKPVHCGVGNSRAREVPASCQPQPGDEQSTSQSDLPNHMNEQTHSCNICCKQFSERKKLTSHIRTHSAEKPYVCDECNKRFRHKWALTKHIQTHSDGKQLRCHICHKLFKQKSNLTHHVRYRHTGERPYGCEMCDRRFTLQRYLNLHISRHAGEKPYSSDVCSQRFIHNDSLTQHVRKHTGKKQYICDVCNRQFKLSGTLKTHKLIHSGEKPYSCEICNKRFRQKPNLERHMRIHTGKKPYFSCNVCDKRFTAKATLTKHMLIHTGEKPHRCDVCNGLFRYKNALKRHQQSHKAHK